MNTQIRHRVKHLVNVGIISRAHYQKRTIAIAKGEYTPKEGEPKIWFESVQTLAKVLSNKNQELLKIIIEQNPNSISALEKLTGRTRSNLSETLHIMERYGIVELQKQHGTVKPIVKATDFRVEFGLNQPF